NTDAITRHKRKSLTANGLQVVCPRNGGLEAFATVPVCRLNHPRKTEIVQDESYVLSCRLRRCNPPLYWSQPCGVVPCASGGHDTESCPTSHLDRITSQQGYMENAVAPSPAWSWSKTPRERRPKATGRSTGTSQNQFL